MITSLTDNQFFVFGSNMKGIHLGGAAKYATDNFGAEMGICEGLTGKCYAFPTLEPEMTQRGMSALMRSRDRFFSAARALPDGEFLMSAVGCGIAGYEIETMKKLFKDPPDNVRLPDEFK